jgi:hypothetical protein
VNGDGVCNAGEPFEDANANGSWDADQGKAGSGGARDAVLYEVQVTYPGSVAKIVKLEHAWRRLDGRNDDGFQVAPFPG